MIRSMGLERYTGNASFEHLDADVPFSDLSLFEIKDSVDSLTDAGDRELLQVEVSRLQEMTRRYLGNVLAYRSTDDVSQGIDEARRRTHNSLIDTLHPIVRMLGGRFHSWFNDSFVSGGSIDRMRVAQWALREAIDSIKGELLHEEFERENESREAA